MKFVNANQLHRKSGYTPDYPIMSKLLVFYPGSSLDKCGRGLYQVRAAHGRVDKGLYRLRKNSCLYQGTTLVGP